MVVQSCATIATLQLQNILLAPSPPPPNPVSLRIVSVPPPGDPVLFAVMQTQLLSSAPSTPFPRDPLHEDAEGFQPASPCVQNSLPSGGCRECVGPALLPLCHEAFILVTSCHRFPSGRSQEERSSPMSMVRGGMGAPGRDILPRTHVALTFTLSPRTDYAMGFRISRSVFWKDEPVLNMNPWSYD